MTDKTSTSVLYPIPAAPFAAGFVECPMTDAPHDEDGKCPACAPEKYSATKSFVPAE